MSTGRPQVEDTTTYTILLEVKEDAFSLCSLRGTEEVPFRQLVGKYKFLNVFNNLLDEVDGRLIVPVSKLKKVRQYLGIFSNGLLGNSVEIKVSADAERALAQYESAKQDAKGYLSRGDGLAEITLDDGCREETVPVPVRPDRYMAARHEKKVHEYITLKDFGYKVKRGVTNSACEFVMEAKRLATYEGDRTEFVPFSSYYPTYESMTAEQREWYFWWRHCIRQREYPDTDLSYIFIYIYELLNLIGVHDERDGYTQLMDLWQHYRKTYPKLDSYMSVWIHDYIFVYSYAMNEQDAATLLCDSHLSNLTIDWIIKYFMDRPLNQFPLGLLLNFCDYPVQKSKFYDNGNGEQLENLFLKVLPKVDVFLQATRGKGIFKYYCPDGQEIKRLPFPGAIYHNPENKTIDVTMMPYSRHEPFRKFITGVMKQTENKLRETHKVKGRLKGIEMEPDLQRFIDEQLSAALYKQQEKTSKVQIAVDPERITNLIQDSDWVRDRLLEGMNDIDTGNDLELLIPVAQVGTSEKEPIRSNIPDKEIDRIKPLDEHILKDLPDEWKSFLHELEGYQLDALRILTDTICDDKNISLTKICEQYLVLPQMLMDMINNIALDTLGDLLIDTDSPDPVIFDEYYDMLHKILNT